MKKFEGILICTDLDGTLFCTDKSVSQENLNAIEHFESEGGIFTFVTGRMPFFVGDVIQKARPNAPFGCINGGGLYDHVAQKYLWMRELEREALELVADADRAIEGLGIQINTFDKIYFSRNNAAMERFRAVTGVPNVTCDYFDVTEPIAKVVFGDNDGEKILRLQAFLESHPKAENFSFIRSERTLFEILPKGSNKGAVLPVLTQHMGLDIKKTVAVGDYHNDIAMIKAAGLGIAVANAQPEVKAAADHVTVSNEESAIARIIADLESGALRL